MGQIGWGEKMERDDYSTVWLNDSLVKLISRKEFLNLN